MTEFKKGDHISFTVEGEVTEYYNNGVASVRVEGERVAVVPRNMMQNLVVKRVYPVGTRIRIDKTTDLYYKLTKGDELFKADDTYWIRYITDTGLLDATVVRSSHLDNVEFTVIEG